MYCLRRQLTGSRVRPGCDFPEIARLLGGGVSCREGYGGTRRSVYTLLRIDRNRQQPPTFHSIRTRSMSPFDLYFFYLPRPWFGWFHLLLYCPTTNNGQMADSCIDKDRKVECSQLVVMVRITVKGR